MLASTPLASLEMTAMSRSFIAATVASAMARGSASSTSVDLPLTYATPAPVPAAAAASRQPLWEIARPIKGIENRIARMNRMTYLMNAPILDSLYMPDHPSAIPSVTEVTQPLFSGGATLVALSVALGLDRSSTHRDGNRHRLRRRIVTRLDRELQRTTLTARREAFRIDDPLDRHDPFDQRLGPRRTAGHIHVNGHELVDALDGRVGVEHAAGAGA